MGEVMDGVKGTITKELSNDSFATYYIVLETGEKIKAHHFSIQMLNDTKVFVPKEVYDNLLSEDGIKYLRPRDANQIWIEKFKYDKLKVHFFGRLKFISNNKKEDIKKAVNDYWNSIEPQVIDHTAYYIRPLNLGYFDDSQGYAVDRYSDIIELFWELMGKNTSKFNQNNLDNFFVFYKLKLPTCIKSIQNDNEEFQNYEKTEHEMSETARIKKTDLIDSNNEETIHNDIDMNVDFENSDDPTIYDDYDTEIEDIIQKQNYDKCIVDQKNSFEEELRNSKLDNETKNLLINIAQNFTTIVSSKPGSGKRNLCEQIMKCLCKTPNNEIKRYKMLPILKGYNYSEIWNRGEEIFNQINYEADMLLYGGVNHNLPLSIITLRDATKVPIDDFFGVFLSFNEGWYDNPWNGEKNEIIIGEKTLKMSETLRFILSVNDDRKGCFADDVVRLVNIVEVEDPIKSLSMLEEYYETSNPISYLSIKECYKDTIKNLELKNDGNEAYFKIYQDIISQLEGRVFVDDYPLTIHSIRSLNAVSRYWAFAKKVLDEDEDYSKETIEKILLPKGMVIDEDCINSSKFVSNGKRKKEIIALDYAISQRIITCITRMEGKVTLKDASELFELLLENKLYKCASCLKNGVESARVRLDDELVDETNDKLIIKKCENLYDNLLKQKNEELSGDESLLNHVIDLMNRCRDKETYTKNVIANMLICLSQGFLTVFSGKPGCGKTSICRIIGESLGLTNYMEKTSKQLEFNEYKTFEDRRNETVDPARYLEVSTERGWTSKRDFIGYYNPITEKFDKVNALLYNTFVVLDHEAREDIKEREEATAGNSEYKGTERLPCFVLLDEANLSAMEYYWADFMNICEADWRESNSIDLGGGRVFRIPETLHFIATINNDHTTEILSPRLIDRANVIDLPQSQIKKIINDSEAAVRAVSWQELKKNFCPDENESKNNWQTYKDSKENGSFNPYCVYSEIKEFVDDRFNLSISPRTEIAVSRYYYVACKLFGDENYYVKMNLIDDLRKETNNKDDNLKLINKGIIAGKINPDEEQYNEVKVGPEEQAMDYAVAQRILPKLTDVSGERAFDDLIELVIRLLEKQLYKSAGIVIDLIERGSDSDFYNFFR